MNETSISPADTENGGASAADMPARKPLFGTHRIAVRVGVELGSAYLKLNDLMAMKGGTIIELDGDIDAPLALYANGTLFAHGEIIEQDGRLVVRVTDVADPENGQGA